MHPKRIDPEQHPLFNPDLPRAPISIVFQMNLLQISRLPILGSALCARKLQILISRVPCKASLCLETDILEAHAERGSQPRNLSAPLRTQHAAPVMVDGRWARRQSAALLHLVPWSTLAKPMGPSRAGALHGKSKRINLPQGANPNCTKEF